MIIKASVDITFPLPVKPQVATWVVQETLPLSHPQNIQSLMLALRKPANTNFCFDGIYVTIGGSTVLDTSKSATELGLVRNAQLTINKNPPASPRRARSDSQVVSVTQKPSPRDPESDSMVSPREDTAASKTEEEEYYVSAECGWFPFSLRGDAQARTVAVIDPLAEPSVDDAQPKTVPLCPSCSKVISSTPAMVVSVDRGYKPEFKENEVVSGWVEKLGGGRLLRWQSRWLKVSEQSIDWYNEEPKPGVKSKIRNTRPLAQDGEFTIAEILTSIDPVKYPKAADQSFHYFGVTFRKENPIILRVRSSADKLRFVGFFHRLVKRWQQHGTSRDPVFWKQWADSLLVAASDVGDVCLEKRKEKESEEAEAAALDDDIRCAMQDRPALAREVREKLVKVEALKSQIRALDEIRLRHTKAAEAAEDKVKLEEEKLNHLMQEYSEEARYHKFLEQRAEEERQRTQSDISRVESEIESVRRARQEAFAKWRRLEEHHAEKHHEPHTKLYSFSLDY